MRLVFEISKDELIAALQASEGDTVSIQSKPQQSTPATAPKATVSGSQPTGAAARAGASAPAAEVRKGPGRKSNAQKEAERLAAEQAAGNSETDDGELDLDAELTGDQGGNNEDDMDGLLQDDPETDAADDLIGDDNVLKKKLADALQANKKKNNGKAGPATDILRKYAPNLSISEVKKKDVPALLKDLAK